MTFQSECPPPHTDGKSGEVLKSIKHIFTAKKRKSILLNIIQFSQTDLKILYLDLFSAESFTVIKFEVGEQTGQIEGINN